MYGKFRRLVRSELLKLDRFSVGRFKNVRLSPVGSVLNAPKRRFLLLDYLMKGICHTLATCNHVWEFYDCHIDHHGTYL